MLAASGIVRYQRLVKKYKVCSEIYQPCIDQSDWSEFTTMVQMKVEGCKHNSKQTHERLWSDYFTDEPDYNSFDHDIHVQVEKEETESWNRKLKRKTGTES